MHIRRQPVNVAQLIERLQQGIESGEWSEETEVVVCQDVLINDYDDIDIDTVLLCNAGGLYECITRKTKPEPINTVLVTAR
jgi:hypothetical protein